MDDKTKSIIRKYAIKNAAEYGKASVSAVLNKVISIMPELKADIKSLATAVEEVVREVNSLSAEDVKKEFDANLEEFVAAKREKVEKTSKPHMELEGAVEGDFATRFPPEPNGYMHIGHAKAAFLEKTFKEMYKGKMFLYFDDTNPETERQEYVDAIKYDLSWLGIKFDREYYASDNVEIMYEYAEEMIKRGKAYACTCSIEQMKANRKAGAACIHKSNTKAENLQMWEEMLLGKFGEDEAVLRFNGDMKSQNTTMRDLVLFRIKKSKHYRQADKYSVWPTYNFNTPIMDSINGVTDVIRSKEYELSDELYYSILDSLGLKKPRIHSIARLEISGNITSKRKLNKLMKSGVITGYDDPRLITIAGLRRRGITPTAIEEFVLKFGMSKTDSKIGIEALLAENRKVIDATSKRLFAVENPRVLVVENADSQEVKIRLHPTSDLGYREYNISNSFYIDGKDASKLKVGDTVKLKDLYEVAIASVGKEIRAKRTEPHESSPKIQWVDARKNVECKLIRIAPLMLNNEELNPKSLVETKAYAEEYARNLKENEIVQFERLGFFKFDGKSDMSFLSL
ncbi:MAG: glutamate--tRNA ligase [Candidatus Micrarchaeaceae archaeon]